jgi:hypothetical protein
VLGTGCGNARQDGDRGKKKLLEAVTLDLEGAIATHASFWHPISPDDNPLLTCPEKVVANFPIRVMAWAKPTGL